MNKKELIERIEGLKNIFGNKCEYVKIDFVIELASELDEPQKPVVPQFVANWIEKTKNELSLREAMSQGYAPHEVDSWLREMDQDGACLNQEPFCRAWLDGYEVEKEKKYIVKLKNVRDIFGILNFSKRSKEWHFSDSNTNNHHRTTHTRKELEDANFGWVFDCEGIEIEEVEG
nr:MAG TPA: Protein of unknown function (DUF1642) [Caudoviricetes sp.]